MANDTLKNIIRISSKIELEQTCGACPESYRVTLDGEYIGNLRLRHGYFSATMIDGAVVYESQPVGDGIFANEDERAREISNAKEEMIYYIITEGITNDH